ncbi:hypothetical protein NVP1063O_077 [Vibrio phage 1.063.O._10N.261.45.C7]|nr:hypothetical protein NVP1063O_077 [Vibrio phage 1.063.O._10N.261.45.C7]
MNNTTDLLLQTLIDTSVQLDNVFSFDSGERNDCTYSFVNQEEWEFLYEDEEAEIIFDSDQFSVMYSPNFNSNVVLKK